MIRLETKYTKRIITDNILKSIYQPRINRIVRRLKRKSAVGVEMTGWIKYVQNYDKKELKDMLRVAREWKKKQVKKVIVIGIGGSYLGIKAGMNMLRSDFNNKGIQVFFAHNMNNNYLLELLNSVGREQFGIIVISKSGTTLEPAIAFNLFYKRLIRNVGRAKANQLVVTVTDKVKGNFAKASKEYGWAKFIIPSNIGGRYSALTPAGMFLFILLGFNYRAIIKGAKDASKHLINPDLDKNDAFRYACYRNYFRTFHRYAIENFVVYDPGLSMISEVWKQLFGESEGKDHKALYPSTSLFTTDLHSMGQYLQEGTRNFFETTLYIKRPLRDVRLSMISDNLKYLNGKKLSYINEIAMLSTVHAHYEDGKTKNLIIYVDKQDAYHFGYLYMWLCFAAMASAYLLRLNPFDQPGVEVYKQRIANILKNK
ncbi:MAG: glucose-6-phosphate isomerase [Mycoplasma sp.]|nr:glucose-6-phosphate isomerase [Candidatus Hennigella equi]